MHYAYKDFYGGKAHIPTSEGTPLYKPYRYQPPPRVGFLRRFGLKGYRFCPYCSGIGYGFEETTGVYKRICRFNSK